MSDTLMWEARARTGKQDDLLRWVEETALPALDGCHTDVYLGGQDRVVVIARSPVGPPRLPDPPDDLLERPAHQWPFRHHRTLP
jgi:hypothetical protein